jgi:hypothetical protein
MNLTVTQRSKISTLFKTHASRNCDAKLNTTVVAFFKGELFFGYVTQKTVEGDPNTIDTIEGTKDIQWLNPIGSVSYPYATRFEEDRIDSGEGLSDFVSYADFFIITGRKGDDGVYEFTPLREFVSGHCKDKRKRDDTPQIHGKVPRLTVIDSEDDNSEHDPDSDYEEDSGSGTESCTADPVTPAMDTVVDSGSDTVTPPMDSGDSDSGTDMLLLAAKRIDCNTRYNSEAKRHDSYKQHINRLLANAGATSRVLCEARDPYKKTGALYLDAEEGCTTRALAAHGFHTEDMYCPNDNQRVIDAMQNNLRRTVRNVNKINFKLTTMETFTSHKSVQKYSYVWIDGMCSWKGSGNRCTRKSVLNLFRKKLLAPFAVVAYTANIRRKKGNRELSAVKDAHRNFVEIRECANRNGYLVDLQPKIHHNNGMQNSNQMYTSWFRVFLSE